MSNACGSTVRKTINIAINADIAIDLHDANTHTHVARVRSDWRLPISPRNVIGHFMLVRAAVS